MNGNRPCVQFAVGLVLSAGALAGGIGCTQQGRKADLVRPDLAPEFPLAHGGALQLDASQVRPMFTELIPIDLASVVRVAVAENFDIRRAREMVVASRGSLESAVGAAFPAIVPTAAFEWVDGTVRATEGNLVGVGFNTFHPYLAVQWAVNPGRVIYDIIAAKKRLSASEHLERAVVLETMRLAVVQYYELVLAQAQVSAADQGVKEAGELVRITGLRTKTGVGVAADELRAVARLAQRQQELVAALADFYQASVALARTLHLHSTVTIVPKLEELPPAQLVREDVDIEELLGIAVAFRPDLMEVRALTEAVAADAGSTWWGAFGPQVQVNYQYGGITGHANNIVKRNGIPGNFIVNPFSATGAFSSNPVGNALVKEGILRGSDRLAGRDDQSFGFHDQQRANVAAGWRLSLSSFGRLKTASAKTRQALIEAEQQLDDVMAQVVSAVQESRSNRQLIALAQQQVAAATEALRLSEANFQAGTTTTLDVLQAQDAATQARFRQATTIVRYNQAQVALLAALGLLDEASLIPTPSTDEAGSG